MPRKTRSDKLDIVQHKLVGLTAKDLENLTIIQEKYQIRSFTDAFRFVLNQSAEAIRKESDLTN